MSDVLLQKDVARPNGGTRRIRLIFDDFATLDSKGNPCWNYQVLVEGFTRTVIANDHDPVNAYRMYLLVREVLAHDPSEGEELRHALHRGGHLAWVMPRFARPREAANTLTTHRVTAMLPQRFSQLYFKPEQSLPRSVQAETRRKPPKKYEVSRFNF